MGSQIVCESEGSGSTTQQPDIKPIISWDISNNGLPDLNSLGDADQRLLDRFHHLRNLDVSKNKLNAVPQRLLESLNNLETLNMSSNVLESFPAVESFGSLRILNLACNKISSINLPDACRLLNLVEMNMERNNLKEFPVYLSDVMPNLILINLSKNDLSELAENSMAFDKLQTLDVSFNHLKTLPENWLCNCPNLRTLTLKGNNLDSMPSEQTAAQLRSLHTIDVSHNRFGGSSVLKEPFYLPKFILSLPSLKYINVSHNRLDALPTPNLWSSTNLRDIDASHNTLKAFNLGAHGKLWALLDKLNLSFNKLKKLPKETGQLSGLSSLNISQNPYLSTIPDEIGKLSRLWEFGLEGLNLDLNSSLLRGRTRDLIGYLHEKLKKSVEFNHMKLMLVGYGGRGKSTLLRALMKQRQIDKSPPTIGVVVKNWRYAVWKRTNFVTYTLNCWDFAGQEDFYSKHEYFLSNRAVYLVVYDLSRGPKEINCIKPWLVNIHASAPHCPVIMVGTHRDRIPQEERDDVIRDMRTKIRELSERPGYPEIKGMIELCCTRENPLLEKLRIIVKQIVDGFHVRGQLVMGQKVPASYIALQDLLLSRLQSIKEDLPILTHIQLWQLVQDAELDLDEDELQQAMRFLHEAGVVLHYEDSAMQLSQLYFIDPEWLCRMMAQIVTVHEINPFINKFGVMKQNDLHLLFTGKRLRDHGRSFVFPASFVPYYMKLLERFQIAMNLNEDELLIPSKLPEDPPVYSLPIKGIGGHEGACLIRRQYLMQYVPFGFGTRFLVRLLMFIKDPMVQQEYSSSSSDSIEILYWRKGIYVCFDEHAFFQVVHSNRGDIHVVELMVPPTRHGARLLGLVVDHLDTMVEEWYPGLLEMTPLGDTPLEKLVPCIQCRPSQVHVFSLNDLAKQAEHEDTIKCPNHSETVPITLLAPEIVLGDFEQHHLINHNDLELIQAPEYLLGDGSFGRVYKAKFQRKDVAVKVYAHGDMSSHTLLRQEATILQKLKHPSLLSMIGVATRPWVLVIELATLGDLGHILKRDIHMNRHLQHRIALQVTDGLQFLHQHKIVYRDMKPDNILVFSLSTTALVNVKISDYGISRYTAPYGVLGVEGTPGYRAPEVLSGQPYSYKADIYSYGITMYKLLTRGKHPYRNAEYTNQLDEYVLKGAQFQSFNAHSVTPWPDMEELINQCLQKNPQSRPGSKHVLTRLSKADLHSLQYVLPVSRGLSVDCLAAMPYDKNGCEVWLACADTLWSQISWINMPAGTSEPTGTLFTDSRILCMEPIGKDVLIVGTQSGRLWVFNVTNHKCLFALTPLSDAVVSLLNCQRFGAKEYFLAGTADGKVAVFDKRAVLRGETPTPRILVLGGPCDAVMSMCVSASSKRSGIKIHVGAGNTISSLKVDDEIYADKASSWKTNKHGGASGSICGVTNHKSHLCVIKRGIPILEKWHFTTQKLDSVFHVDTYLLERGELLRSHFDARILSFCKVKGRGLWLGTASGHLVLVCMDKLQPMIQLKRHSSHIRSILWIPKPEYPINTSTVVVSGMGFVCDGAAQNPDDGCLTIWDADILTTSSALDEHLTRRTAILRD